MNNLPTQSKQTKPPVSAQTRNNWLIDAGLLISALVAALSGIYFLFLPVGGYQGGRNPWYNVQILFSRQTWDNLHTWFGVAMVAVAILHLIVHGRWVVSMTRRTFNELTGKSGCLNPRSRWNLILNSLVGISFLLTALSGVYFLFVTGGRSSPDPHIIFSRNTWDMVHTWAGVVLIATAIIHFAIHWRWVSNVTAKILRRTGTRKWTPQPVES